MSNRFLFGALALLCSTFASAAEPAKPLSVERLSVLPAFTDPLLSADGHRIAALAQSDGKSRIAILDADRPGVILRTISMDDWEVGAIHWAGSDRLLVTVQGFDFLQGLPVPFLRLVGVDVSTGATRLLDTKSRGLYAGDVLHTSADGRWALVASQDDIYSYPSVKRVDLATGKAEQVEKPRDNVWDWFADEQGVVRAGIAYQGKRWTLWYRDSGEEKLRKIKGKIDAGKDGAVDRFIFRGGQSWIVTNERTGRFALYNYDLESGEIGAALFEHPSVDIDDVTYDHSTGEILAVEYEDDRRHQAWFDADLKGLQAKLDKALPDTVNLPIDMSTDENRVLVHAEGSADPGRYFLLDRRAGEMHAVVDPYPNIDPAELTPSRWVQYRARDGLVINGYLTLPKDRTAQGLPLVVMPHGGPFERDHWEFDPLVQLVASRGYAVLQPQFRGSTGFGRDFVEKGYGEWGYAMQDDLDDGVSWLASEGTIDARRVCIIGASYGGYAALWASIRNPDRYRCAVSLAGVSDLSKQISANRKVFSATRYFKEWRDKVDGQGSRRLDEASPINFADRVSIPLLIGHGEKDSRVASSQSHAMVAALKARGASVESVFYPDAGHGFTRSEDQADWFRRIAAFLRLHNPA